MKLHAIPKNNSPLTVRLELSPSRSVDVCNTEGEDYRFGFNGKEKDNQTERSGVLEGNSFKIKYTEKIAGIGNHNSALFWEYDTRLGRRWNLDPVDQISISNYASNYNNPITITDINGDRGYHIVDKSSNTITIYTPIIVQDNADEILRRNNENTFGIDKLKQRIKSNYDDVSRTVEVNGEKWIVVFETKFINKSDYEKGGLPNVLGNDLILNEKQSSHGHYSAGGSAKIAVAQGVNKVSDMLKRISHQTSHEIFGHGYGRYHSPAGSGSNMSYDSFLQANEGLDNNEIQQIVTNSITNAESESEDRVIYFVNSGRDDGNKVNANKVNQSSKKLGKKSKKRFERTYNQSNQ